MRVSQLNEDKDGVPTDPTQKTLTNFILSGDTFMKDVDNQRSVGSETSDGYTNDEKSDFSFKSYEPRDNHRDHLDHNENSDKCAFNNNPDSTENFHNSVNDPTSDKVGDFFRFRSTM